MFEIEWINNRGDREMNDVKMQRAKREWVPFTVMSEQLLSMRKVIGEKLIVMLFIIYTIIYFNVLKIKNTYMKEVL